MPPRYALSFAPLAAALVTLLLTPPTGHAQTYT